MRGRPWVWLLLALLLVAAALRFYRLEGQSLWADEGNSVAMTPRAPLDILQRSARDIHPPLYYLVLRGWAALTGSSVFAVRTLSVFLGLLTIALTAALGRRIGGWRLASFATLAAAISPFALHYAQETRMYMLVTALGAACFYVGAGCWVLGAERQGVGIRGGGGGKGRAVTPSAVPHLLFTTYYLPPFHLITSSPHHLITLLLLLALLHTHYYAVSLVVALNLFWLWGTVRAGRWEQGWWVRWVGGQFLVVLLYLPWLWYARETILNWPAISSPITLPFIVRETFRVFSVGLANEGMSAGAALGFGGLLLAGIAGALRAARRESLALLPLFYVATPPLLMLLLSLDRPFWNPKFLLLALPGFHLLVGQGVAALLDVMPGRVSKGLLGVGVAGFLLATAWKPLQNEFTEQRYWRDDYRAMARLIAAQATPQDAVLLDGAGQREVFDYYFDGLQPVYGLPAAQPLDEAATVRELERIAATHPRLFVLWWAEEQGDPTRLIPRWLDENGFEAGSRWFGDVRLATYRLGELPPPAPLDASFTPPDSQGTLHLRGASIEPLTVVAGEVLALHTRWAREGDLPPTTFFAQLLDGGNHVVGQYDGDGGALPVADWQTDTLLRFGVPVAVGTPPGEYRLILGAYRADTGQRFLTDGRDAHVLATVRVVAPIVPPTLDALALPPDEVRRLPVGDLLLVGVRANKLGFDHAPDTPLAPGEPLSILLYWQARRAAPTVPALMLRLRDGAGNVAAEWPLVLTDGRHPPAAWREGNLIRDPHTYFLPIPLPPGSARLLLFDGSRETLVETLLIE